MTHYTSKQQSCKLSTKSSQNLSGNVVNNKSEWKYFHIILFCHYFVLSQKIMAPNILYSIQLNKFVIQNLLLNDITNYCFFYMQMHLLLCRIYSDGLFFRTTTFDKNKLSNIEIRANYIFLPL